MNQKPNTTEAPGCEPSSEHEERRALARKLVETALTDEVVSREQWRAWKRDVVTLLKSLLVDAVSGTLPKLTILELLTSATVCTGLGQAFLLFLRFPFEWVKHMKGLDNSPIVLLADSLFDMAGGAGMIPLALAVFALVTLMWRALSDFFSGKIRITKSGNAITTRAWSFTTFLVLLYTIAYSVVLDGLIGGVTSNPFELSDPISALLSCGLFATHIWCRLPTYFAGKQRSFMRDLRGICIVAAILVIWALVLALGYRAHHLHEHMPNELVSLIQMLAWLLVCIMGIWLGFATDALFDLYDESRQARMSSRPDSDIAQETSSDRTMLGWIARLVTVYGALAVLSIAAFEFSAIRMLTALAGL